ncbi:MAG: T9SS type A sorting domain-containing protein, partial [Bacteroidota bacterium]|nr:T9SS type A sorting domain-containing protein [Bacteroidota bacterium]
AIHSESENMTNDFESIVKVYPNPASNYLFIETHENSQAVGELTIVNQSGQIVYQNHTTKNAFA